VTGSLRLNLLGIAIHPDAALATERFVGEVLDAGYQMMVYTVDDHRVGQDLLELGVDAICTNRPDLFL
jgi:glycerophosphoryl diester phosphodiesterase